MRSRPAPPRPSDIPFLVILLALHAAVLVCIPIAAYFLARVLGGGKGILVAVFSLLVEIGMAIRAVQVYRRLRLRGPAG